MLWFSKVKAAKATNVCPCQLKSSIKTQNDMWLHNQPQFPVLKRKIKSSKSNLRYEWLKRCRVSFVWDKMMLCTGKGREIKVCGL